jgi:hypothetical protein
MEESGSYPETEGKQVLISGIDDCDEDLIHLLFANKNRSGGGPIEDLNIDKEKGTVLITYEKREGQFAF